MALSGFLSFIDSEAVLIFVIILGIAGLLFLYAAINKLKNIVPYIYPNARIRAKEAKLIQKDLFDEMITASSVSEVLSILENTDYAEYLQNVSLDDPKSVEISIDSYLSDVYYEIEGIVPKKDFNLMKTLMAKWDAKNLKYVIRNSHLIETGKNGMNLEDLTKSITKSPLDEKIKDMVESQTIDELAANLDGTYFDLKDYIAQYRETKNLAFLENSLYKLVYNKILDALPSNELEVKRYFTVMLSAENIRLLLRAKKDGIRYAEIEPFLVSGLFETIGKNFDELDIEGIINELDGTEFYKPLEEALPVYNNTKNLSVFDNVLERLVLDVGRSVSVSHPFGLGPIIGFLAVKTAEAENVKRIISAKYFNLPSDNIKPLIITTS